MTSECNKIKSIRSFSQHCRIPGVPYPEKYEDSIMRGDILIEPAIEQHVADCGAHCCQVETEEGEVVEPE